MKTFGELLHLIRSRQNASQLVKEVGISYVYLLDIEKKIKQDIGATSTHIKARK